MVNNLLTHFFFGSLFCLCLIGYICFRCDKYNYVQRFKILLVSFLFFVIWWLIGVVFCDSPESYQLGLQDPATLFMECALTFWNDVDIILFQIAAFCFYFFMIAIYLCINRYVCFFEMLIKVNVFKNLYTFLFGNYKFKQLFDNKKFSYKYIKCSINLELAWVVIPICLIFLLAISGLWAVEEFGVVDYQDVPVDIYIKGSQWYWSYRNPSSRRIFLDDRIAAAFCDFPQRPFILSNNYYSSAIAVIEAVEPIESGFTTVPDTFRVSSWRFYPHPVNVTAFFRSFYESISSFSHPLFSAEYVDWRIRVHTNTDVLVSSGEALANAETPFYKMLQLCLSTEIKLFELSPVFAIVIKNLSDMSSGLFDVIKLSDKSDILGDVVKKLFDTSYVLSDAMKLDGSDVLYDVIAFDCLFPSFERFFGSLYKEAFMLCDGDLQQGAFRLLETDYKLLLPVNKEICGFVESSDVIHSWAVPSFGIKIDACPGRISRFSITTIRPGIFYGQCFELCGVGHAFMPICVQVF